jgi:hypothetical protein
MDYGIITVRSQEGGAGTLRGWSYHPSLSPIGGDRNRIQHAIYLINNGQVIADSYGNDARELRFQDLYYGVDNTIDNEADETNGWYAQDHGKLVLPAVPVVASADGTYNWGEKVYNVSSNPDIDLVNSMQFTVQAADAAGGDLEMSLLASDRTTEGAVETLWTFGYRPLAIWELSQTIPFTTANVTVRYDQTSEKIDPFNACGQIEDHLVLAKGVKSGELWFWSILSRGPEDINLTLHELTATEVTFPGGDPVYLAVMQQYPGDANLDGAVDVTDLLTLVYAFGTSLDYPEDCDNL